MQHLGGRPYLWATEFENVHSLWHFSEPRIRVNGRSYPNSEEFFHAQKPNPFDRDLWDGLRDDVMRAGVRAKFEAGEGLRELLLSTHPHPLLALKPDQYWGFDPRRGGENMLARLLEELRDEMRGEAAPAEAADDG